MPYSQAAAVMSAAVVEGYFAFSLFFCFFLLFLTFPPHPVISERALGSPPT